MILHGYLLSGTGSNVYNASLGRALRGLGHEVHLVCQERGAAGFEWVDSVGDWDAGSLRVRATGAPPAAGSVTVYRPDIGGLLPVFVPDRYSGFEVRTFAELTDAELERYIRLNVAAVRDVIGSAGAPDAALANHLVMAPVVLARAGLRYALKVHGSDLSYTILPDLARFGPFAREAAAGASGILVGSGHIAERLRQAIDDPEVVAKVRLGPPGVDVELFAPVESRLAATERLRGLARALRAIAPPAGSATFGPDTATNDADLRADAWSRDVSAAAASIDWFAAAPGPRVVFVGKLIVAKGVDLLLTAWPLVHREHPEARLLIAGFGAYREGLERLWTALAGGDLQGALTIADQGRGLEGGAAKPLPYLISFLSNPPLGYAESAAAADASVAFAGRLEHAEVGQLVPAADALAFPSTHPEAFGMVAAEAAAAGVLPVSAAHSGALEVSRALAVELPPSVAPLLSFPVDDGAVEALAGRLLGWLALDRAERDAGRTALRATSVRLWGWEGVARAVLAAAVGELGTLPRVAPPSGGH